MTVHIQPFVAVQSADRVYGSGDNATAAVLGATCQVLAGDRIALVGPSGSGKSTLLHLVAGLDEPTRGSVTWPALGKRETLRPSQIGVAFQSLSLIPWLSVVENVLLPLQLVDDDNTGNERALEALHRFALDGLATKLPEELSGGQAQRVSLVRATITNPKLVIADEPTGQIDRATATDLVDMLLTWAAEEGSAVLLATHDMAVADRFGSRWTMSGGVLNVDESSVST